MLNTARCINVSWQKVVSRVIHRRSGKLYNRSPNYLALKPRQARVSLNFLKKMKQN